MFSTTSHTLCFGLENGVFTGSMHPSWIMMSMPKGPQRASSPTSSNRPLSSYDRTSGPVKAFVGGLTDLFVGWNGRNPSLDVTSPPPLKSALSLLELEAGLEEEYAKNFLWNGDINQDLYEENCSFTDPTLSFSGLTTYKKNVGSLQGLLNALVSDSRSILYSCDLFEASLTWSGWEECCVRTRWRMLGALRLPWSPVIDVTGRTAFTYDTDRGNRIVSYDEVWEIEPAEALLQLFQPGRDLPLEDTDATVSVSRDH
ncbi:unnamed protein product [Choristocarpus tenellus]